MNKTAFVLILVSSTLGIHADCKTAEKPKVRVQFVVGRPDWRRKIRQLAPSRAEEELFAADLDREVSANLATVFDESIGFIDFVADSTDTALILKVILVSRGQSGNEFTRTNLRLELHGLAPPHGVKDTSFPFAEGDEGHIINRRFFETKPGQKVKEHLAASANQLVEDCLSRVAIAREITLVHLEDVNTTVGVLPWSHTEIGADHETEFQVTTLSPVSGFPLRHHTKIVHSDRMAEFIRGMVTEPFAEGLIVEDYDATDQGLDQIPSQAPNPTAIEGLFIEHYKRLQIEESPSSDHDPGAFEDPNVG